MPTGKTIYAALMAIQQGLKVPKSEKGYGYNYRTADGILQAVKPLLQENGVICLIQDESLVIGNRYYIKATATLVDIATGDCVSSTGVAVEPDKLASMAPPQITGTSSTYARKRALEGLLLLDNEQDVDSRTVQDNIRRSNTAVDDKQQALHQLNEAVKKANCTKEQLVQIAKAKYKKSSTAEMTASEIKNLATNLAKFIKELPH